MIRDIVRDTVFLSKKSKPASRRDLSIGQDLLDTLHANSYRCVGLAANMIGELKNIIVVHTDLMDLVMYNAKIIEKSNPYEVEEGCLSLDGQRKTMRYELIRVQYRDASFSNQINDFHGFTAQIIQHELDHCNGILI